MIERIAIISVREVGKEIQVGIPITAEQLVAVLNDENSEIFKAWSRKFDRTRTRGKEDQRYSLISGTAEIETNAHGVNLIYIDCDITVPDEIRHAL